MPVATPLFHRLPLAAAIALTLSLPALAATSKPTELDRVQVKVSTATRSERLLSDVPIRTEVLRKEDIALRAATDFSRAAELINGLRVESNCQNCNTSEVQLLGLPGAYNQLLFDGIPLLSTLGSVYGLEQIPAGFVDRIEVVKGGGSALYGPGAVAGVINLIPPLPARSGGHVQAGVDVLKGTPQKNADVRLDLVAKDADAGLSVIAQRNWNSGIDYNGDGYTEITRKNLKVGGLQAWYAPTPGTRLRLDLQVTDETRRGGNRLDQPEYLANIAESLDTKYRRGSVSWDQEINADVDFRLAYAFADIDRDSFYGGLGDVVTDPSAPGHDPSQLDPNVAGSAASRSWRQYGRTHNPLHYIDSQLNWRLGAHALAFGVQYKHEALRDDNRTGDGQRLAVLEDATFHNLGAFIQDEWSLRDNVDLVLGARVDKSSELDSAVFSPRIALAWQATPNLKWRAGIATGFRAPEIFVEDVHVDTLGGEQVRVRNTDGLKEERALTTLFGFDWRSDPANPVWSWDATASYARIRDTFALGEIQRGDDGQLSQLRYNASGSNVLGGGNQPRLATVAAVAPDRRCLVVPLALPRTAAHLRRHRRRWRHHHRKPRLPEDPALDRPGAAQLDARRAVGNLRRAAPYRADVGAEQPVGRAAPYAFLPGHRSWCSLAPPSGRAGAAGSVGGRGRQERVRSAPERSGSGRAA